MKEHHLPYFFFFLILSASIVLLAYGQWLMQGKSDSGFTLLYFNSPSLERQPESFKYTIVNERKEKEKFGIEYYLDGDLVAAEKVSLEPNEIKKIAVPLPISDPIIANPEKLSLMEIRLDGEKNTEKIIKKFLPSEPQK